MTDKKGYVRPLNLLSANRIDVIIKYLSIKYENYNLIELANTFYDDHINIITNGLYEEPGNTKKSLQDYKVEFNNILKSIDVNGFDKTKSHVPLSKIGTINNGSHRVAASLYLNKDIYVKMTNEAPQRYDIEFFRKRGLSERILEDTVHHFLRLTENNFLAIIWPSANKKIDYLNSFNDIIYEKKIKLDAVGARNFVTIVYQDHEWLGSIKTAYNGAISKVAEAFQNFSEIHLIFFKENSTEKVNELKSNLRNIFGIGKSSLHITDNNFETKILSNFILNKNGLHFINNSNPFKFEKFHSNLKKLKESLITKNISFDDIILCGSSSLGIYGIREPKDIDYLSLVFKEENELFQNHINELHHYGCSVEKLIYDPSNYFYFNDLKFLSLKRTLDFKKVRNEIKDQKDVILINKSNRSDFKLFVLEILNQIILLKYKLIGKLIPVTKKLGIYNVAKFIYKKLSR